MNFKLALKIALLVVGIWTALQFSLVIIQRMQIKQIMEDQVLEALRMNTSEEGLIDAIEQRMIGSNIDVEELEFHIGVLDFENKDIEITAMYNDPVNLFVYQIRVDMEVTAESGGGFDGN
ncbi:hypothetical protein KKF91_03890 [Myxococcota bacterium]|nr:hypothetical protein [Myxococcota bacterium]MBU1429685.1 hypothetical protein [Myxococcota bacterium]MBU1898622.1 hypothetical protein [Myxococcota bacterium]